VERPVLKCGWGWPGRSLRRPGSAIGASQSLRPGHPPDSTGCSIKAPRFPGLEDCGLVLHPVFRFAPLEGINCEHSRIRTRSRSGVSFMSVVTYDQVRGRSYPVKNAKNGATPCGDWRYGRGQKKISAFSPSPGRVFAVLARKSGLEPLAEPGVKAAIPCTKTARRHGCFTGLLDLIKRERSHVALR